MVLRTTVVCGFGKSIPRPIHSKDHRFPASGYRNNSSGSLNNVGSNGYYWSASPNSTNNGHNLNFNSSNWNWNNNNRANGFPVRPVAEAFAGRRTLPFFVPLSSKGKRLHLPFYYDNL